MEENESGTLKKILAVAEAEFLEKGFLGASLREMAKKAGVTTGAFYGYFKSKEELFDALVKAPADYLRGMYDTILGDFKKLSFENQVRAMESYSALGIKEMFSYAWEHKRAFYLIVNCASGTKYEHFVKEMAALDILATDAFYTVLECQGIKTARIAPLIEKIITEGTFASFFALLFADVSQEEAFRGLSELFTFYRNGWNGLMRFAPDTKR